MSVENKALVRRFFAAIEQGNAATLDEVMVEDYVHHDLSLPPEMQRGREAYKQGIGMLHAAFPDWQVAVEDLVAEGDEVAVRVTVRGTHRGELMGVPPSGNTVDFGLIGSLRIADGRIAEGWVTFDALGMMQQIGAIPAPEQATA